MSTEPGHQHVRGVSGVQESSGSPGRPSTKRRRPGSRDEAPVTKRRRATTACSLCRARKAKCDNVRPQCGFCRANRAVCQYEDDHAEPPALDQASQEILGRLDELKSILTGRGVANLPLPLDYQQGIADERSLEPQSNGEGPEALRRLEPAASRVSPESLLRWPVFRGLLAEDLSSMQSFLFDGAVLALGSGTTEPATAWPSHGTPRAQHPTRQSINEDDMPRLCSKFIQLVHPRNPILDTDGLLNTARSVAEHGLGWDATSCLLLIACGIACLTVPWATPEYFEHSAEQPWSPNIVSEQRSVADAYFQAARERIGLLDDSVIAAQCLFFASVYEKHALRAVEAYQYIRQGFSRLQVHRLRKSSESSSSESEQSESRLFWSLSKAERYSRGPFVSLLSSGLTPSQ